MPLAFINSLNHALLNNLEYSAAGHTNFVGTKVQNSYFGLNIFQSGIISNTSETGGLLPLSIFTNNLHCASFMSSGTIGPNAGGYIRIGTDDGTPMQSGMCIGGILFRANPGGVANQGAAIRCYGEGTWNSGQYPTSITFDTCGVGSTTQTTKLRIGRDGTSLISGFGPGTVGLTVRNVVNPTVNSNMQRWENFDGSGILFVTGSGFIGNGLVPGQNVGGIIKYPIQLGFIFSAAGNNQSIGIDGDGIAVISTQVVSSHSFYVEQPLNSGALYICRDRTNTNSCSFSFGSTNTITPNLYLNTENNAGTNVFSPQVGLGTLLAGTHSYMYWYLASSGRVGIDSIDSIGISCWKKDSFRITPSGIKISKESAELFGNVYIGGSGLSKNMLVLQQPQNQNNMAIFIRDGNKNNILGQIDASGNFGMGSGNTFRCRENMPNSTMGTGILVLGTTTVNTTAVTQNSRIFVNSNDSSVSNMGTLSVGTRTIGTSFVVNSTNSLDARAFSWIIFEPT